MAGFYKHRLKLTRELKISLLCAPPFFPNLNKLKGTVSSHNIIGKPIMDI